MIDADVTKHQAGVINIFLAWWVTKVGEKVSATSKFETHARVAANT